VSTSPPPFLQLAGHPLRWRILLELAQSDRKAGELTARLRLPQSLCAYHLGRLRDAGLVFTRRSTADARTTYYAADLPGYASHLSAAGAALHPALGLPSPSTGGPPLGRRRVRVLFLCTGNSARSQMAEALAVHLGQGTIRAFSAGSRPKPIHPNAVRVMREYGLDLEGCSSKHLRRFAAARFDHVITLCDRVREISPEFPGHPRLIHWSIPDPAAVSGGDAAIAAFRSTAAELEERIRLFLHLARAKTS
jgi:ArsR family transcriptional regulator, arsenate/arsenite/antimonite-responsive transcriptional repressor / arsenate reductase (thioredoxin)